jgi:drug/metabolite transporter (DMT)-like permease
MAGVAFFGALNSWFWITALKRGGVSLVATVSYLSLPLAYATGYLMFGEVPDAVTLAGSAVVLAAVAAGARPSRQPVPLAKNLP